MQNTCCIFVSVVYNVNTTLVPYLKIVDANHQFQNLRRKLYNSFYVNNFIFVILCVTDDVYVKLAETCSCDVQNICCVFDRVSPFCII